MQSDVAAITQKVVDVQVQLQYFSFTGGDASATTDDSDLADFAGVQ